jgi:hypothetical protein
MDELWAICPVAPNLLVKADTMSATLQAAGAIDCRLSVDGGSTYLYWDGAAWSAAGANDFSPFDDINANVASIPFTTFQLAFQVRLLRGGLTATPILKSLRVGYRLMDNHEHEDPHRTIRRFLSNNCRIRFRDTYEQETTGTVLNLGHPLPVASVVSIYNLTGDPTRTTDIAAGTFTNNVDGTTGDFLNADVDMTASQTAGDILEINWVADPRVDIAHVDQDVRDESNIHVPVMMVQIVVGSEYDDTKLSAVTEVYTTNGPLDKFWADENPVPMQYQVTVYCLAADELLAIKMANAGYKALRAESTAPHAFRMVLSGAKADIIDFSPPHSNLTDTSENLSVKAFTFILYTREWLGEIREGVLTNDLIFVLEE